MARVKGAMMTRKRRNKTLKMAKGYWGSKSKHFRVANQAVMKSLSYAYTGRRLKKRDFRSLWITRISAACKMNGMNYSSSVSYTHLYEEAADGEERKILLSKNFRSRREILDAANFIFSNILSQEMGEKMCIRDRIRGVVGVLGDFLIQRAALELGGCHLGRDVYKRQSQQSPQKTAFILRRLRIVILDRSTLRAHIRSVVDPRTAMLTICHVLRLPFVSSLSLCFRDILILGDEYFPVNPVSYTHLPADRRPCRRGYAP